MANPADAETAAAGDLADRIVMLIRAHRFRYRDESQLQAGISQLLTGAGIAAIAEARLNDQDRIDFLAGPVGIEVKVAGTGATVTRQLRRYAASPLIGALVLVTNRARHRSIPAEIGGKLVRVVWLSGVTG